jgi:hypothetical protein
MDKPIRPTGLCTAALLIGTLGALPAQAQVVVKVNDDVNFKLGVLGQFQADTIDNPEPEPNTSNLFVRRLRLMFGGQVAKNVSFFVETDAPNLGKTLPVHSRSAARSLRSEGGSWRSSLAPGSQCRGRLRTRSARCR